MKKILYLLFVMVGCTSPKKDEVFEKSVAAHELALKTCRQVGKNIKALKEHAEVTPEPKKTMLMDSVENLLEDLQAWEKSLVEVPGHEHDHDHGHAHEPTPNLTPEMVLEVQNDLKNRIVRLNDRVRKLLMKLDNSKNETTKEKEETSGNST